MKKFKLYKIEDPIYRAHLSLLIGDLDQITKFLIKAGVPKEKLKDYGTGRFMVNGKQSIIILPKYNLFTLVHEITHYAFAVMDGRGIPIRYENDETIAYYVEMVLRNILSKLKKNYA